MRSEGRVENKRLVRETDFFDFFDPRGTKVTFDSVYSFVALSYATVEMRQAVVGITAMERRSNSQPSGGTSRDP
jgi:hypothetical protein